MTFKILRRPFQPDRLLGDSPAPQATLFRCATGFAFLAVAAAIVSFTKDPPVAIAGILFFLAFIASLVLLILGMAARRM